MADRDRQLAELGEQCASFAVQCSDVAGFANQVNQRIVADNDRMMALRQNVADLASLQHQANDAAEQIAQVAGVAGDLLGASHSAVDSALGEIGDLIDSVVDMGDELQGFVEALEHVGSISTTLERIARQTGMLAINASIEAAHAGVGASGFAAVATEVKRLAGGAREVTREVTTGVTRLEDQARAVIDGMRSGAARGRTVRSRTNEISHALAAIAQLVGQFGERASAIRQFEEMITRNVTTLDHGFDSLTATATANMTALGQMRERLETLEGASNRVLDQIAHSGVVTADTPFVEQALEEAAAVTAIVEQTLAAGTLTSAALFDTGYSAVPGTDPPQFMTDFVPFADSMIRPLLDRATARHPEIVGCCLVDVNGHLPTHISARSRPQRAGERQWNLENARNRQIFMDSQTRRALDADGDFFLFTYRQDFGDGRYRTLRSVFVPLYFAGRRWGLYELGYLI